MPHTPLFRITATAFAAVLITATASMAISPTENDDFEDGTEQGWTEGGSSPNKPGNQASGGPAGVGDNWLRTVSSGIGGAGSRAVYFNRTQWTGDYTAVGSEITIQANFKNDAGSSLSLRLGVTDNTSQSGGTKWVTTTPVSIPTGGAWQTVTFVLREADMTQVTGTSTLAQTLAAVAELRILQSASPAWIADKVASDIGMDNFRILSVPVELEGFSVE